MIRATFLFFIFPKIIGQCATNSPRSLKRKNNRNFLFRNSVLFFFFLKFSSPLLFCCCLCLFVCFRLFCFVLIFCLQHGGFSVFPFLDSAQIQEAEFMVLWRGDGFARNGPPLNTNPLGGGGPAHEGIPPTVVEGTNTPPPPPPPALPAAV